jgi:hypothetical protein
MLDANDRELLTQVAELVQRLQTAVVTLQAVA